MQQVYFVRHGETDWNSTGRIQGQADIPLNRAGQLQANVLSSVFQDIPVDICFSSPFARASETAAIILKNRDIPVIMDDRLKEISYGKDEGQDLQMIHKDPGLPLHAYFHSPENYIPPDGGETIPQLQNRCGQFLDMLKDRITETENGILVTTHGAWIQAMISLVDKRPLSAFWQGKKQENCSLTMICLENSEWKLIAEAVSLAKD